MASASASVEAPTFSRDCRCFRTSAARRQRRCGWRRLLRAVRSRTEAEKPCVAAQELCLQHADGLRASRRELWTSLTGVAGLVALQCPQVCLLPCLLTAFGPVALQRAQLKAVHGCTLIVVCPARKHRQQGYLTAHGDCWARPRSQSQSYSHASC